ncbi:transposase family protein [Streptomyces griseomycini]|uniref:transposase family protein n=1 Tax=Streptomyces griseomycini TaxID=66895 RepID=UPI0018773606|nr:transposase family protein [Streptomyces griseomycini]
MGVVVTAAEPQWVDLFAGLNGRQFRKLVGVVRCRGGGKPTGGRPWALPLESRVLLVAAYWRTNRTMRQLGPLFGISKSAADRVIDHIAPLLALTPVRRRHPAGTVLIVDGTLVPTRDRSVAASSKKYRYSTNHQVVTDANTRLVVAAGCPLPGNRHDTRAYRESGVDRAVKNAPVLGDGVHHAILGVARLHNLALAG